MPASPTPLPHRLLHFGGTRALRLLALPLLMLLLALLAACAPLPPTPPPPQALLADARFAPPAEPVSADTVFALDDEMRAFAAALLASPEGQRDARRALVQALTKAGPLRLRYDTGGTRTAAQAFHARAGNCLSLTLMTAAFARHLELPLTYQAVQVDDQYTRSGTLVLSTGHVNLVLGRSTRHLMPSIGHIEAEQLLIDFLPADQLRGQRTTPLPERTIVAMYMNNRAAEALAEGQDNQAYWWAREALLQDPAFDAAANTLAVIYQRRGLLAQAEAALRQVLARNADHVNALANLANVLRLAGRPAEAAEPEARLARLQPDPPFHDFDLGRQALAAGDDAGALAFFRRELRQQPDQPEVHFWTAIAAGRLGDREQATRHLRLARDNSTTTATHALYGAKLDHLQAQRTQ
jgi:Tfp pilus assembly protein PilF